MGTLYYGDNLDLLRRYLADETVDLVYLDPPFDSAQTYNASFHEKEGTDAASQIKAFEDTWQWNQESEAIYRALTEQAGRVKDAQDEFGLGIRTAMTTQAAGRCPPRRPGSVPASPTRPLPANRVNARICSRKFASGPGKPTAPSCHCYSRLPVAFLQKTDRSTGNCRSLINATSVVGSNSEVLPSPLAG